METRANHVYVGAVTLALVAMLAAFIIWIARLNEGQQNEFDIFFKQSVDGLAKGSEVAYAGVPVGQIKQIELWDKDPNFVRVRIAESDDVPILMGTTATRRGTSRTAKRMARMMKGPATAAAAATATTTMKTVKTVKTVKKTRTKAKTALLRK